MTDTKLSCQVEVRTLIIKIKQEITFTSLTKYFRYRKFKYYSTRIRKNKTSNLNKNTQNLSISVRYANFCVKKLRKNNAEIAQFYWSKKSRDSCPSSSGK